MSVNKYKRLSSAQSLNDTSNSGKKNCRYPIQLSFTLNCEFVNLTIENLSQILKSTGIKLSNKPGL